MVTTNTLSPLASSSPKASASGKNKSSDTQGTDFSDAFKSAKERSSVQLQADQAPHASPASTREKPSEPSPKQETAKPQASEEKTSASGKKEASEDEGTTQLGREDQQTPADAALLALQSMLRTKTTIQTETEKNTQSPQEEGSSDASSPQALLLGLINQGPPSQAAPALPVQEKASLAGKAAAETSGLEAKFDATAGSKADAGRTSTTLSSPIQTSADEDSTISGKNGRSFSTEIIEKNIVLAPEGEKTSNTSSTTVASFSSELTNAHAAYGLKTEQRFETSASLQVPVHTPVAHQNWADEVGQSLSWVARQNDSKAELILTPANMGKIEVSINLNGDQASAAFSAANPAAREALEDALPRLREVLAQAGIQLGEANVNAGTQGQSQTEQGLAQNRERINMGSTKNFESAEASTPKKVISGNGLVDLFA